MRLKFGLQGGGGPDKCTGRGLFREYDSSVVGHKGPMGQFWHDRCAMMSGITKFVGCGGVEGQQRVNCYYVDDATVGAALLATGVRVVYVGAGLS